MIWESKVYEYDIDEGQRQKEVTKQKAAAFDQLQQQIRDQKLLNTPSPAEQRRQAGLNQSRAELAQIILNGTPEEAGLATEFAMPVKGEDSRNLFSQFELGELVKARGMREAANTPYINPDQVEADDHLAGLAARYPEMYQGK